MGADVATTRATIDKVWEAYQDWATYSRDADKGVKFWRKVVLALSVFGAVLETLSGVLSPDRVGTTSAWVEMLSA